MGIFMFGVREDVLISSFRMGEVLLGVHCKQWIRDKKISMMFRIAPVVGEEEVDFSSAPMWLEKRVCGSIAAYLKDRKWDNYDQVVSVLSLPDPKLTTIVVMELSALMDASKWAVVSASRTIRVSRGFG